MQYQGKWVLISVYNKTGIVELAGTLVRMGWNILASGGTARVLSEADIPVRDVASLVGGGAILKHRVVTLSRELHAGLLADKNDLDQVSEMKQLDLPIIDMVFCDFYPLSEAIAKSDATIESVVELTDIGGPTMVRSAAKGGRIVVCRFEDRQWVLDQLKVAGDLSPTQRESLRARAEFEVARYCMDSARFHSTGRFDGMLGERVIDLPKGENGCQVPAGLYKNPANKDSFSLGKFQVIDGVPLSYNNFTDLDRLLQTLSHITESWWINFGFVPAIAVGGKHGNACGAAAGDYNGGPKVFVPKIVKEVARKTVLGDTRAIFGGLVICNFPISNEVAEEMVEAGMEGRVQKFDAVIAPDFEPGAVDFFERKGNKCRCVKGPDLLKIQLDAAPRFRMTRGGDFLMQPNYTYIPRFTSLQGMQTIGELSLEQKRDLVLADAVCRTSNSNTITIVKDSMLLGNGVGQKDRVGAAELAIKIARDAGHGDQLEGAVAASDSFFPFDDAPKVLAEAGVKTIFSTTGSINDKLTQDFCAKMGVTLCQLSDAAARGFFGH